MLFKKKYNINNILFATLWVALGGAAIFLLMAAIKSKDSQRCKGIAINIHGASSNLFVDTNDIKDAITIQEKMNPVGKPIGSFNLKKMELELEKNIWIKAAELFFDNNEILQVSVHEREPVARIFTTSGTTFYIDEELDMLPLSEKFSARLPVFTGFPSDRKVLLPADSSLLLDIKNMSLAIRKDPFSMAMIEQVDINPQRIFELIPKIGNQVIVFGDAKNVQDKLDKIKLFYKEVMVKSGWNNYSVIDVQYANQVVAKRKGAADIAADSLRTKQLLQLIAERAKIEASDSLQTIQPDNEHNTVDSTMIQQSIQRDDSYEASTIKVEQPELSMIKNTVQLVKPEAIKKQDKPVTVKKPVSRVKKPAPAKNDTKHPKAVMPNKNDYAPIP